MIGALKSLAASSMVILLATMPTALADGISALTGNWARDDGTARITISPCGSNLCAVNIWVNDPSGKEKIGDKLVLTLRPESASKLQGQAYDVRRQARYKMTITLNGKTMETSGCVLLGVVCKSVDWTRMD